MEYDKKTNTLGGNKQKEKSPRKGTRDRYRCRDALFCTHRDPMKTLNWKFILYT